ncbi:MAG TPA: MlaD family protein [Candidatus Polarisedimenticolia bacterium]|nr:MlaD family protein [Candidatus Polarisedimenticolia bacterium]
MKRHVGRDAAVGMVVLLAALIFTIGIFSIGSEQRIWVSKVGYKIRVPDANGLQSGSPVRLAGVQVGTINRVDFPADPGQVGIEIGLSVDEAHQHRIREDTVANVKILTLLAGEKYVELTPGSPDRPALPPGSYITVPRSFGMEQLGELSANLAEDLGSISSNVRVILETVQRQEGVVGRMLLDPNFGQQTFDDVARSARLARETIEDVHDGKGLVGKLLVDDEFARETTRSLRSSLDRIEALLDRAGQEDGVLMQALEPDGKMSRAIDNLHQATADLRDFTADAKEGRGMIGKLVSDQAYAEEVLGNIRQISRDLSAITSRLNAGEGTLGGLINDPQLIEDLKNVVRGVQKSRVLSGMIRHYRKKGEKVQLEEEGKRDEGGKPAEPQEPEIDDPGETSSQEGGR